MNMPIRCPRQWRDALSPDLHLEHPGGPLSPGSAVDRSPELRYGIHVDGFHHNRGTLRDGAHKHLGNETQGPAKGFDGGFVLRDRSHHLDTGRHEGTEEFRWDAVTHVSQPQRRNVVNHFHWVLVDIRGHVKNAARDEVQVGVGLLEKTLACMPSCKTCQDL